MLRDFVIALSLSNLWFFNVWRFFLINHSISYPYYHWKANPAPVMLGTMLDVLILSGLLWLAVTFARRSSKRALLRIARLSFALLFYVVVVDLLLMVLISGQFEYLIETLRRRPQLLFRPPLKQSISLWLGILGSLVGFTVTIILFHRLMFRRQQVIKVATELLLIVSPFVLFTFGQTASQWIAFRSGHRFIEVTASPSIDRSASNRRVIWIIFDEMDFRLSFSNRPSSVQLPEFDRLRAEAIFGENAYPPGGDTVLSMPSLTTGRLVAWSHRSAANELMLTFADKKESVPWSAQPNVFSRARGLGFATALAGWYHPYCRIIGHSLTKCFWETYSAGFLPDKGIAELASQAEQARVVTTMLRIGEAALLPESIQILMASHEGEVWRNYHLRNYASIHREAMRLVGDPNLHLILLHYPVPHPPGIYDRSRRDFSFDSTNCHFDNLALADRTVAELRQQIERAGLWESSTVLISSDHRLRADRVWRKHVFWQAPFTNVDPVVFNSERDERVPFILKIAGEKTGLSYDATFNTVLSQDLILAVLSGELSNKRDVANWLNQNRSVGQSPYVEGDN